MEPRDQIQLNSWNALQCLVTNSSLLFEKRSWKLKESRDLLVQNFFSLLISVWWPNNSWLVNEKILSWILLFWYLSHLNSTMWQTCICNCIIDLPICKIPSLMFVLHFILFHPNIWWLGKTKLTKCQNYRGSWIIINLIHVEWFEILTLSDTSTFSPLLLIWFKFNSNKD